MYVSTANENGSFECGLGCAQGMGALTMDGSGLFGTGVFGTGVTLADFSTWGAGEIGAVAVALFLLFSVVGTTKRGAEKVGRGYRTVKRKVMA